MGSPAAAPSDDALTVLTRERQIHGKLGVQPVDQRVAAGQEFMRQSFILREGIDMTRGLRVLMSLVAANIRARDGMPRAPIPTTARA